MLGMVQRLQRFMSSDGDVVRQVDFLLEQCRILRAKVPGRVNVTAAERARLVELGNAVGPAVNDLVIVVTAETFAGWRSGKKRAKKADKATVGRPRTDAEIEAEVLRIARQNVCWGYKRIRGDLAD